MQTALNQITTPNLSYGAFLDLAASLGCVGVEVRNDLERQFFDGIDFATAGRMARDRGLRIVGLGEVYPFNSWSDAVAGQVRELIAIASAAGAETINLIPRNDGSGIANGERQANLRIALKEIRPMIEDAGMTALIEPLGFATSSLRQKRELVGVIDALEAFDQFRLVHDTFHHALAGGESVYPEHTGIVHISGVVDPNVPVSRMQDAHRVLIDERDRLGSVKQISELTAAGYSGPFSFECFAPETHALADPEKDLSRSFDFISSQLEALAA